jgi:hypothetical protein
MEAATMVLRTLTGITGGLAAGIVLGARVPILLPQQHDAMDARIASCVLARLVAFAGANTPHAGAPTPALRAAESGTPVEA